METFLRDPMLLPLILCVLAILLQINSSTKENGVQMAIINLKSLRNGGQGFACFLEFIF
jgi:hypothetical protein